MDGYLGIVSRREARAYDGRVLEDDVVRKILEAGRLAGSSRNRQARRFIALRGAATAPLAETVWSPENVRRAALVIAVVTAGKGPLAFDAGRAAQNMLLAAHDLGVGSCPNGVANAEALHAALGLTEGEAVATLLSFGYPSRPRDPQRRSADEWIDRADRLPFDDVVELRDA